MKKFKALVLIALCTAAFGASGAFAADSVPDVYYGTAKVDGVKDAVYEKMKPISTDNIVKGTTLEEPSSAKVWMAWDDDALYVYAEVEEETPANESPEEYKQDSIEVFTDEDNSKSKILDGNDTQYRVTSKGSQTYGNAADKNFVSAAKSTDTGYAIEMMLPWLEILPNDGTVMGFDILVNDAVGSERLGMMAWSTEDNTNYLATVNYGEIRLVLGEAAVMNKHDEIRVSINGYKLDCGETKPFIESGRTLVPMRAIFEALDCEVCYNESERAVYTVGNGKLVKLVIDNDIAEINGEPSKLDVSAKIVNGRTVVPLRFIAETLNKDVDYNGDMGVVFIKDKTN